ncbi:hypothetical protein L596_002328 [Steinernema carpocapsae]|uniref:Uncharacterized protein n=1 Tax=Steinernema carpocapsae TaxID=34508 RepID=A0A4U8UPE3_STECR|nr:hypothetical protein L596_002328 [Steinernema carpocapsae]
MSESLAGIRSSSQSAPLVRSRRVLQGSRSAAAAQNRITTNWSGEERDDERTKGGSGKGQPTDRLRSRNHRPLRGSIGATELSYTKKEVLTSTNSI